MATSRSARPYPVIDWLSRRSPAQRRIAAAGLLVAVTLVVLQLVARLSLDRDWFAGLTAAPVFVTKLRAQALLAVTTGVVSVVSLLAAARFAYLVEPAPGAGPNRLVNRYRERMGPAHGWLLAAVPLILAGRFAAEMAARWQPWLLFLHGSNLDSPVPGVGMDLGYHLYRLSMVTSLGSWLRAMTVTAIVIVAFGMIANGALKIPRNDRRSSQLGLSVLASLVAVVAVLQAVDYVLVEIPRLATGRFGSFDGAGFTEVEVVRPALWILAAIALVTAGVAVSAARSARWSRLTVVLFGWGVLHLSLLVAIPALVQTVVVAPAEASRQLPYLAENLEATRRAYGLETVDASTRAVTDGATSVPVDTFALARIPLFGESQMVAPLQVLQGTTATRIADVDLDRYEIDGVMRPVLVAARSASAPDLPERGWVQRHLVYTHGDGVVMIPADSTDQSGQPDLDALALRASSARSELYFGEGLDGWYVITGTRRTELGGTSFEGDTGLGLESGWSRLRLALAAGEIEPLFSSELLPDSRLLYRRSIAERLGAIAPFLSIDANAYPVVSGGRITWVVDGYTTSATYPFSQYLRNTALPAGSGLAGRSINYAHASVKATIDAYDGTVHLYRTEVGGADDPILDVWDELYPGLLEPIDQMPADLRAHLLYPQDLLTVQTTMLGRYHVTDPESLFSGIDSWSISAAAGSQVLQQGVGDGTAQVGPSPAVSMFMPDDGPLAGHWVALRPFGPGSADNPTSVRDELSAIAIADHDDPERLQIIQLTEVPGRLVSSPLVAQSAIDTDSELASVFTLLNANGSVVEFGPMTPVLLDDSLSWIRPIVVTGAASTTTPRVYGVAAVSGGSVGEGESVHTALEYAAASAS